MLISETLQKKMKVHLKKYFVGCIQSAIHSRVFDIEKLLVIKIRIEKNRGIILRLWQSIIFK